ncbi:MAG: Periplasmic serine endoprotease DegP-like, partial [Hyphomicrobiales bacterium]|nr:Periplasmic serine endoprotease DegP-like [Hyphomicrobiales bacterium]
MRNAVNLSPRQPSARRGLALVLALALASGAAPFPAFTPAPAFARGAPESFADLAAGVSDAVVNISAAQAAPERRAGAGPREGQGPG